jgi:hypothetical protein
MVAGSFAPIIEMLPFGFIVVVIVPSMAVTNLEISPGNRHLSLENRDLFVDCKTANGSLL